MASIVADNLRICSDCLDAVEFDDLDLGYTPGTLFEQMKKMMGHREDLSLNTNRLVSNSSSEFDEFSTRPCDTCGTHMAGARYGYSVLAD